MRSKRLKMRLGAFIFALVRVWVNGSDFDLLKAVKRGKTFGKAQIFFSHCKGTDILRKIQIFVSYLRFFMCFLR